MTLWLMRQYVQKPTAWGGSLLGAMLVLQWPVLGMSIATMLMLLQLRAVPGRATVFDAALPISARDLVTARLFARLLLLAIPTLACVVAWRGAVAVVWPMSRLLELASIVTLAQLLPICVRPGVLNLPAREAFVLPFALLAVVSGLILWLLPSVAGAAILGSAVVVLVAWTVATTPASFERVASGSGEGGELVALKQSVGQSADSWRRAWRPILQSVTPWPVVMSLCGMIVFGWLGDWLLYTVLLSVGAHLQLRQRTAWLAALPLSHRARLMAVVIPFCVSTLGGVAIGRSLPSFGGMDRDMSFEAPRSLYERGKYFSSPTRVPLTYWRRLRTRPLPTGAMHISRQVEVVSPWGETAVADTFTILGAMYFNPYTTGPQSSTRFVDWQFGKATSAVYGRPISMRNYNDESIARPPSVVDAWSVQLLGGGLTLTLLFYMLFVYELPLSARASCVRMPSAAAAPLLLLFLPVYTIGGICIYFGYHRGGSIAMPMIERALLATTRALPDNVLVVALIAAIPPVLIYLLLEWQFSRSEVPRVATVRR